MGYEVVCITAGEGAAGDEIAGLVAQRLGFRLVGEQILALAAREAGVEVGAVADVERRQSLLGRLLGDLGPQGAAGAAMLAGAFTPDLGDPCDEDLRGHITAAIEEVAALGAVVIVAHAASHALAGRRDTLRVLLTASPPTCRDRVAAERGLAPREAARLVARREADRADYLKRFYRVGHERATDYDVVLNTDRLAPADAAGVLARLVRPR
jgi:hypothetical protein